jgi:hypothetical protein
MMSPVDTRTMAIDPIQVSFRDLSGSSSGHFWQNVLSTPETWANVRMTGCVIAAFILPCFERKAWLCMAF